MKITFSDIDLLLYVHALLVHGATYLFHGWTPCHNPSILLWFCDEYVSYDESSLHNCRTFPCILHSCFCCG